MVYKYLMDLTTNGVIITDAIKFVQTNKEKLAMSTKEEDRSKEPKFQVLNHFSNRPSSLSFGILFILLYI
jgi:hypothetical protein